MKAGDVQPYFENLQADLAQEADPQLRHWYETEVSLSPEYQEATALREKLERFRSGLSQLIEQASAGVETADDNEVPIDQVEAEAVFDEDEYLTPEERKHKSVLAWLKEIKDEHGNNVRAANLQPRKSKREKQLQIANNRFKRHFEQFGPDRRHIVYDAEALGSVLIDLAVQNPELGNMVIDSSIAYMHQHGLEFAQNYSAFANVIRHSTSDVWLSREFDRIFTAIYEKQDFVNNPEHAARLHIALAHAFFETAEGNNKSFYEKIIDTAYLRNNIIPDKSAYASALSATYTVGIRVAPELRQLCADLLNASSVFTQGRYAYLHHHTNYFEEAKQHQSDEMMKHAMGRYLWQFGIEQVDLGKLKLDDEVQAFFNSAGHYDPGSVFNLITGETNENVPIGRVVPEEWRIPYTTSDLYRKKTKLLSPRANAHDIITTTLKNRSVVDAFSHIVDLPSSPGVTATFAAILIEGDRAEIKGYSADFITEDLNKNHKAYLRLDSLTNNDSSPRYGTKFINIERDGYKLGAFVVLRPSIPEDRRRFDPHYSLTGAMTESVYNYFDTSYSEKLGQVDAKRKDMLERQHNYIGRRPILFRLPDNLRANGLNAISARKHPDRRHVIVTAHHDEGDLEFLFDQSINYVGEAAESGDIPGLRLVFEDLVVSLIREWACRPVIETSEGVVSHEDNKSKVNLGFLRYLPEGFRFSERQRIIFRKEQHGNLAAESLRRKAQDPSGLGRNSTYVRESYDPSKPPLEVYYDPEVLKA